MTLKERIDDALEFIDHVIEGYPPQEIRLYEATRKKTWKRQLNN